MISINIQNFSKSYGNTKAVQHLSLEVNKGELFGLIGPDGAGKTTVFRMLTTLLLPDEGSATVEGLDIVKDYKEIRKIVGYMPGRFSLYQDLSVEENLNFFATVFGTTIAENYELIKDIYEQIKPFSNRRAGKLSGGMKQKLALCCALVHQPSLLFLDEPTIGLDYSTQCSVRSFLKEYVKQNNASLILTSHNIDDIKELSDNILILNEGKQLFLGTISELYMIVKPKKFLEFKMDDETIKQVEIQQDNQKFLETIGTIPSDRLKEINLVDMDLNEVIEELYRRSK